MKKTLIFNVFLVLLLCVCACVKDVEDSYVALQDDEAQYGMSIQDLKNLKGPYCDVDSDYCDTPFTALSYHENIQGLNAETTYVFKDHLLNSSLNEVCYLFDPCDYDTALSVAKCIYNNVKDEYDSKDGFYEEGFAEENDGFYANLGTINEAIGVSVTIDYSEGRLSVSATNQE